MKTRMAKPQTKTEKETKPKAAPKGKKRKAADEEKTTEVPSKEETHAHSEDTTEAEKTQSKKKEEKKNNPGKAKKTGKATTKKAKKEEEDEEVGEEGEEEGSIAPLAATDFKQPIKDQNHLKIVSWNVAGWKSVIGKGFSKYVQDEDPDIICLQETKVNPKDVTSDFLPGYHSHFYGAEKKGYSGTGIFSKIQPISWTDGIGIPEHDDEGRVITAEYDTFYLVNTYIPNASRGLVNLPRRMKWDKDFLDYLQKLDAKKPIVWCGDLNVAHKEIDLTNPSSNKKSAGFTLEERQGFSNILAAGFVDTFRHLYPSEEKAYTFWSYFRQARTKNIGWRLDYFVISKRSLAALGDSYRRPFISGSDHCPIVLHIDKTFKTS